MCEEWCRMKLANLKIEENRSNTLVEIRDHIVKLPEDEAVVTSTYTVPAIFNYVEDFHDNDQINLACEVLSLCMSKMIITDDDIDDNYVQIMEKCLKSSEKLKLVALTENERILRDFPDMPFNIEIVKLIIMCLENESLQIKATKILIQLFIKLPSQQITKIQDVFERVLLKSDSIKCLCYDIAIKVSIHSLESLCKMEFILNKILNDINGNDILLQLNVLDLLSELPRTEHGFNYYQANGIFQTVSDRFYNCLKDPDNILLSTGYMKFFGNIAYFYPIKTFTECPNVLKYICNCIVQLNTNDITLVLVAMETFGVFVRTDEGKIYLDINYRTDLCKLFVSIKQFMSNVTTQWLIRTLNALEIIFQKEPNKAADNQLSSVTERWYKNFTNTSTDLTFILNLCRNPFPDIKIAALTFLGSICSYRWGQIALAQTSGFIEYLLDRTIEFDPNVLHEKFKIIKLISDSKPMVYDGQTAVDIRRYITDGTFHVSGVMEVEVSDNN